LWAGRAAQPWIKASIEPGVEFRKILIEAPPGIWGIWGLVSEKNVRPVPHENKTIGIADISWTYRDLQLLSVNQQFPKISRTGNFYRKIEE
jgi:hypothetical protein